jgi:hypothetical protein
MKIKDLPMAIDCAYVVTLPWSRIMEDWTQSHAGAKIEYQPDFQRGYVWTEDQKEAANFIKLFWGL